MWRFKPLMPKEQNGLEGRTIDIGKLKVQVRNVIAEGGFSCVYLARDVLHGSNQYALKHIICNDEESLELVMKEISVMKSLKGHPNIVTLHAHTMFDLGRTKEAILVMEYCEKSLVSVLESRGAAYFEEKQIFTIFRDVCNAVFAMHCQSPPIAHRDLKAENLLLGSDGLWKLCDFGSTSTNHKVFDKPEEMGIEEDNIRKHTTPAYRAPEMWDLYRRELINEKVDIWALGCLLFRICYFKSAFDGESKLQVLNGNYRIPEIPKYSTSVTDLIRDMLQSSPDARPDITQVWFRVNGLLPDGLQKSLPDRPPEIHQHYTDAHEANSKPVSNSNPVPRRSPPPPPQHVSPASQNSRSGGSSSSLGVFWTQHAQDSVASEENVGPKFEERFTSNTSLRHDGSHSDRTAVSSKPSPSKAEPSQPHNQQKDVRRKTMDGPSKDFEINFFHDGLDHGKEKPKAPKAESKPAYQSGAFNVFDAEFGSSKLSSGSKIRKSEKEELLEAEIAKLKEQFAQADMEKDDITTKYEKLSAICRSQRQEIQELKQALATRTPAPSTDAFKNQASPGGQPPSNPQREKIEGTVWELQEGFSDPSTPSPDAKQWQAFTDDSKPQATSTNTPKSVRTRTGRHNRQAEANSVAGTWGFGSDNFTAVPASSTQMNVSVSESGNSQRFDKSVKNESAPVSQPAGWAGF